MWQEDKVNNMLREVLVDAFNSVLDISEENDVTLRMGAYMIAIKRLVTAEKIRGMFP